ncbi:MAG: isopentenyl-diphosphate Delta-isomerase [Pseudonocardiales bacterium]
MPAEELVVLLGADRRPIGSMPKAQVHTADTPLHLAFSVYVFDRQGRFLATRRALAKRTWAGVWTNSCCGHPGPDEGVADAARRRLGQELGLTAEHLDLVLADFAYRATSADGIVENEVCPVFVARVDGDPSPDPAEVAEWHWVRWADFQHLAATAPWALSPWAAAQTPHISAPDSRPGPARF